MRQKRGDRKTSPKPPSAGPFPRSTSGAERAQTAMAPADSASSAAPATNTARQPNACAIQASGVEASSEPDEPIATSAPDTAANRNGANQPDSALSPPIRMPAVPTPISARPIASVSRSRPSPNAKAPATAASISRGVTMRAPYRSRATPSGSCAAAKPRK